MNPSRVGQTSPAIDSPASWTRLPAISRPIPRSPARRRRRRCSEHSSRKACTEIGTAPPFGSGALVLFPENLRKPLGPLGRQESPPEPLVLEEPRDARERLEMHPRGVLRCEDQEKEPGRLPVEGGELHPRPTAPEDGDQPVDPGDLPVGNRHPFADSRAPQPLAVHQDRREAVGGKGREAPADDLRELAKYPLLRLRQEPVHHGPRGDDVLDPHRAAGSVNPMLPSCCRKTTLGWFVSWFTNITTSSRSMSRWRAASSTVIGLARKLSEWMILGRT